jgi:serine/threonine protein phosphatase PrpC
MLQLTEFQYDTATAIHVGRRERQEDSIATNFPAGTDLGFLVLADGMGGHASGDIASKIVVTEVFSELMMRANEPDSLERQIGEVLREAAYGANTCLGQYPSIRPESAGMGSTLLAPVVFQDRLYWISIGDSPLFLYRDGQLRKLNADHSLAPHFDGMVSRGEMEQGQAENHPDRNCLTSVLIGADIPHIDCRTAPLQLQENDVLVAASDGLSHLSEEDISATLAQLSGKSSADILSALLGRVQALNDPEQDNITLCVIRISRGRGGDGSDARPAPKRGRDRTEVFASMLDGTYAARLSKEKAV